jgi:WD40 repeat protein/tRNA A-37 threonylcarbamoyl transferase component Bud32
MHILCPHCRNPVELVTLTPHEEISCPSCGSSFRLETNATTDWVHRPGQKLGRFELLEILGQGAFGTVYKARDPELDRTVALKVPRAGNLSTPQDLDRFLREARSAAQLRHPSIVAVHEVGAAEGVPFIVSDCVEGVTLTDLLSARRPGPREAAELIAVVAEALQFAHDHGVVHRDIKPSNIMIGSTNRPCVMDFGLAKRDAGEITMTVEGQVLGTPAYMSPEQAGGEGHRVDGRSDVYSLGVILYLILTGELPFRGTKRMLLYQVLHDEPRPPRRLNDRIPRDLETITLKAMAKDPRKRYQSAAELAADLHRWLDGKPIVARPVGPMERTWRWCRRNPALAAASALAVAALLAVTALSVTFAVSQANIAEERLQTAEDLRQKEKQATDALARETTAKAGLQQKTVELGLKQGELSTALGESETIRSQLKTANDEQRRALQQAARTARRQGLSFCEAGETRRGLLWLVRGLELAPRTDTDFERSVRTDLAEWRAELTTLRTRLENSEAPDEGSPFPQSDGVGEFNFSPDGQLFHIRRTKSIGELRLLDQSTGQPVGKPLRVFGGHDRARGEFAADGKILVILGDRNVHLVDAETGAPLGAPLEHPANATHVALSRDRKRALVACRKLGPDQRPKSDVYVWDLARARLVLGPLPHDDAVHSLLFLPDDQSFLSADWHTVRLWDLATGKPKAEHRAQLSEHLFSVALGAGARALLVRGYPETRLLDARTLRPIGNPLKLPGGNLEVAFTPDGKHVLTRGETTVQLWDAVTGAAAGKAVNLPQRSFEVQGVFVSPDGRRHVTITRPKDRPAELQVRLIESASGKVLGDPLTCQAAPTVGMPTGIPTVLFVPGENLVIFCAQTEKGLQLHFWSADTGKPRGAPVPVPTVHTLRLRPDGKALLVCDHHNALGYARPTTGRWWDLAELKPVGAEFPIPLARDSDLQLSSDGRRMVGGFRFTSVRSHQLWEVPSAKPGGFAATGTEQKLAPDGIALALAPDMRTALVVRNLTDEPEVQLWDIAARTWKGEPMRGDARLHAFSPDGMTLLVAAGAEVHVRDVATGRSLGEPLRPEGAVVDLIWAPDGRRALLVSDGHAQLWDVQRRQSTGAPIPFPRRPLRPAFDERGASVAVYDEKDKRVVVWNTATGERVGEPVPTEGTVSGLELKQGGGLLVIVESRGGKSARMVVQLWDVRRGRPIGEPLQGSGWALDASPVCAVSPNGNFLALSEGFVSVRLYDTKTAAPVGASIQHPHVPVRLVFGPRGDQLLTITSANARGDRHAPDVVGTARLWAVPSGFLIGTFEHKQAITEAVFSPDGSVVLTASADGTARLWNCTTGKPRGDALPHTEKVTGAVFSPDGTAIATRTPKGTLIWDRGTGKTVVQPLRSDATPLTPDSSLALVLDGSSPTLVTLFDVATGKPLGRTIREQGEVRSVLPSPDRRRVLTMTFEGLRLWNADDGAPLGDRLGIPGHPPQSPRFHPDARGGGASFSPDGRLLAAAAAPKNVGLWDTATGILKRVLLPHPAEITWVMFSPDGTILLTGCEDFDKRREEYRLWEVASGNPVGEPWSRETRSQLPVILAPTFSPDSRYILTRTDTPGRSVLRDTKTGKPVGEPLQHPPEIFATVFSPDSGRVFTGTQDKVQIWEVPTGKPLGKPVASSSQKLAISTDGAVLVTLVNEAGNKTVARRWNATMGEPLDDPLTHADPILGVRFTADGKALVTISRQESRLWDPRTGKPLAEPLRHASPVDWRSLRGDDTKVVLFGSAGFSTWDIATGKPAYPALSAPGVRSDGLNNPVPFDGRTVITTEKQTAFLIWDTVANRPFGKPLRGLPGERPGAPELGRPRGTLKRLSPDRQILLAASDPRTLVALEVVTGEVVGKPLRHLQNPSDALFSPDSRLIVTFCPTAPGTYTARLWSVSTGRLVAEVTGVSETVASFAPDSRSLLVARSAPQNEVLLVDTQTGEPVGEPLSHPERITAAAFSSDGQRFATVTGSSVRLWETATRKVIGSPLAHPAAVQLLQFSPDGRELLTAAGTQAWCWDATTGREVWPAVTLTQSANKALFSPDGRSVLLASVWADPRPFVIPENVVQLFATRTGQPLTGPLVHRQALMEMVFRPDGNFFLTVDYTGIVRVWEAGRNDPVCASPPYEAPFVRPAIRFEGAGWSVVTTYAGKGRRTWHLPLPVEGSRERQRLWIESLTGVQLDEEGVLRVLDPAAQNQRRLQLAALLGPPLP